MASIWTRTCSARQWADTVTLTLIKLFGLLAIFAFIVLLVQQLTDAALTRQKDRSAINKRLRLLGSGMERESVTNLLKAHHTSADKRSGSLIGRFYRLVARADIGVPPSRLIMGMGLATAGLFVVLFLLAGATGSGVTSGRLILLTTISSAVGIGLPLMVINRRAEKRRKRMEEQFPTAVDIFTRALRAGHPVSSAIGLLTTEMEDPIGSEFGIVADEVAYGSNFNESLDALAKRWGLEDLQMFAVCLSVQSETGGNLAEILGNLSGVIRDRASLYKKVRALSSEGRMSAWMLSILPVLTFVVLFIVNPGFYLDVAADPLFTTGFVSLLSLYAVGVFWLRRMVDLKV